MRNWAIMQNLFPNLTTLYYWNSFWENFGKTMEMFFISGIIAFVIGIIFGVILIITRKGGIKENTIVFHILDFLINVFRAIPFIILMILLLPVTRDIVGTGIGVKGAIIPLVFGTVPFFSRQVETSLNNVDEGKIEAAKSLGVSDMKIIMRVYLNESVPELSRVTTITAISLIGLTTMAGAVGAGGLGDFAINYGYGLNNTDITIGCVIILLVVITIIQIFGTFIARNTTNKKLINIRR